MRSIVPIPPIPQESPAFLLMRSHLVSAARDLFSDFDIAVFSSADCGRVEPGDARMGVAVIGYAGQGVRGALVMSVGEDAVRSWMEAAGVTDGDLVDTLGEFSNMLLGRLKARLLPRGISILATTPTAVFGADLRLSDPPCNFSWEELEGPDWHLRLRLEASFDSDFKLLEQGVLRWNALSGDVIDFESVTEEDAK